MNSDYHRLSKAYLASKEAFQQENFGVFTDGYKPFLNVNNGINISMKNSLTALLPTLFSPATLPANMTEKQFNDILNKASSIPKTTLSNKEVPTYIFNFEDSNAFDGTFDFFLGPFKFKTIPKATYRLTTSADPKPHWKGIIGGSTGSFSYSLGTINYGKNSVEIGVSLKISNKRQKLLSTEKIGLFNLHESVDGGVTYKLRAKFIISFSGPTKKK